MADEPEVDLDFDLFNFAEVMPDEAASAEEDVNLDEIFSAFEEEESAESAASAPQDDDDGELGDDLFGDAFRPAGAELTPVSAAAAPPPAARERETAALASSGSGAAPAESAPPLRAKAPRERAEAPAPEPPAPPAPAPRRRRLLASSIVAIVIAMTLLNVSVALVTFRSAAVMPEKLESATREMAAAALRMRAPESEPPVAARPERAATPSPALAPEDNATLERAALDIEAGAYAEARRRVYALLSVADRTPQEARADLEARSLFLLARSYRAEALHAGDPR